MHTIERGRSLYTAKKFTPLYSAFIRFFFKKGTWISLTANGKYISPRTAFPATLSITPISRAILLPVDINFKSDLYPILIGRWFMKIFYPVGIKYRFNFPVGKFNRLVVHGDIFPSVKANGFPSFRYPSFSH